MSLSCIFSINPLYEPENYLSDKLDNELGRHNLPNKSIQNVHITVALCGTASVSHQMVQEGAGKKSLSLTLPGHFLSSHVVRKYAAIP